MRSIRRRPKGDALLLVRPSTVAIAGHARLLHLNHLDIIHSHITGPAISCQPAFARFSDLFLGPKSVKNRPKINAVDSRGYPWPWQRLYDPSAGGRQRPGAGQLDREANRRPEKIQRFFKRIMSPGTAWI